MTASLAPAGWSHRSHENLDEKLPTHTLSRKTQERCRWQNATHCRSRCGLLDPSTNNSLLKPLWPCLDSPFLLTVRPATSFEAQGRPTQPNQVSLGPPARAALAGAPHHGTRRRMLLQLTQCHLELSPLCLHSLLVLGLVLLQLRLELLDVHRLVRHLLALLPLQP